MDLNKTISYLLFPGIILHELGHVFACLLLGIKIKKVKLLGVSGGFVVHEDIRSYKTIIIALSPFMFNIAITLLCTVFLKYNLDIVIKIILVWIGVSALFFCIPSSQDTNNVLSSVKVAYTRTQEIWKWLYKIIILPITLLIVVLSLIFKVLDKSLLFRLILIISWFYFFVFI